MSRNPHHDEPEGTGEYIDYVDGDVIPFDELYPEDPPDDSHARMEDAINTEYEREYRFSDLLDDRTPDEHSEDL